MLSLLLLLLACSKEQPITDQMPQRKAANYEVIVTSQHSMFFYRVNSDQSKVISVLGVDTLQFTLNRNDKLYLYAFTDYPTAVEIQDSTGVIDSYYYPYNHSDTIQFRATW